jgi:hypothetical protein
LSCGAKVWIETDSKVRIYSNAIPVRIVWYIK